MEQVMERHAQVAEVKKDGRLPYEEVAALAYAYWEARGGDDGGPEDVDWFRAERKVREASVLARV